MSSEPVNAFFPSIDRTLMRDLDRQLRGAPPETADAPDEAAPASEVPAPSRPDIAGVVEAVEQAASSLSSMAERIRHLEDRAYQLEVENDRLTGELADLSQARDGLEAALRAEHDRGQRIEALAAHHIGRATTLERDLDATRSDLARVMEAITRALGASA